MAQDTNSVSLKEHFREILIERDKAVAVAMSAAKEAVGIAEKNAEKWRDNANEWRGAMNDKDMQFALKTEVVSLKDNIENSLAGVRMQLDDIKTQLNIIAGRKQGISDGWGWLAGAIFLLI